MPTSKKAQKRAASQDAVERAVDRAQAPESTSGRRLSPWRVIGAALVAIVVVSVGAVGFQWWSARAAVDVQPWFASYVDVTATPRFAFENLGGTSTKDAVLSFVVSSKSDPCAPSWGAAYSLDQARGSLDLDRRIARLQQQGGTVAVSFGGQANDELSVGCVDASDLKDAYAAVVDRYKIGTIDLDLEGAGLADRGASVRRATAIAALQQERRAAGKNPPVWLALPPAPPGLPSGGTGARAPTPDAPKDIAGITATTRGF